MKKLYFAFIPFLLLFALSACRSGATQMFHYIIKNVELDQSGIRFDLKNSGKKNITGFAVHCTLEVESNETENVTAIDFEKTFNEGPAAETESDFLIGTREYEQQIKELFSIEDSFDLQDYSLNISRLYIREIDLEDGEKIKDRFGFWSF